MLRLFLLVSGAIAAQSLLHDYVPPVIIENGHFVDSSTGARFQMKGIDYQPGGSAGYTGLSDPLSNVEVCARDIYLMQELGINTVRVYTVNPRLDHSECMTLLAAANMYLILDVNSPLVGESLNRYEPWTTYTPQYLRRVFEVVDEFSKYNNTLAFFIGNEVVNDERSADVSPPYIRAVLRDVKEYIYYQCPRLIPLGYSAADDLKFREELPEYLSAAPKNSAVDFYGVNSYQWCGKQTLQSSGYNVLAQSYNSFGFPVILSEFGCNIIQPRIFQEIEAIFQSPMSDAFDGGLVYEYSQGENDYGLVDIFTNGSVKLRPEFPTLQKQYLSVPTPVIPARNASHKPETSIMCQVPKPSQLKNFKYITASTTNLPHSFGTEMIRNGIRRNMRKHGSYVPAVLTKYLTNLDYAILGIDGSVLPFKGIKYYNKITATENVNVKSPARKQKLKSSLLDSEPTPTPVAVYNVSGLKMHVTLAHDTHEEVESIRSTSKNGGMCCAPNLLLVAVGLGQCFW